MSPEGLGMRAALSGQKDEDPAAGKEPRAGPGRVEGVSLPLLVGAAVEEDRQDGEDDGGRVTERLRRDLPRRAEALDH